MEGPREIPGFDRATGARGEHQVMGGSLMRGSAEDLQLSVLKQGLARYPEQGPVTTASCGLDRTGLKSAPGSQQLLANTDDITFQIHIVSAQPSSGARPVLRCRI